MAVRIENGAAINFGTFEAETEITHGRISVGNAVLTTRPLANARTIAADGQAQFDVGEIDLIIQAGDLDNAGLNALLALALDGNNELNIDAMTSAADVVDTNGYSQQSTANWNLSNEDDV